MNTEATAGILLGWRFNIESLLENLDDVSHMEKRFCSITGERVEDEKVIDRHGGHYLRLHVSNNTASFLGQYKKYKKSGNEVLIPISDWNTIGLMVKEECGIGFAPSTSECSVHFQVEYHEHWGLGFWVAEASVEEIEKLKEKLVGLLPKLRQMLPGLQIKADQIKLMPDVLIS